MIGEQHVFRGVEYRIITPAEAHAILKSGSAPNYRPYGRFLLQEGGMWVAIDNEDGNAWTEEFYNRTVALKWLCGVDFVDTEYSHKVDEAAHKRLQTMKIKGMRE